MKLLMYENSDKKITLYNNVPSEILELAYQAANRIHVLLEDLAFGDSIKEAIIELREACHPIHQNQCIQHRRIERKVKMFLSEFSILLNHWEKKAKHQNGNCAKVFRDLTHHTYDTCDEYGFTYNLRNYAIHGNNVVNQISFWIGNPYVLPLVNRDALLENYKKWKPTEVSYIQNQSEYFDILPVFEKSYQAIQKIHLEMMDHQLTSQTIADCEALISLQKKALDINPIPGIWDIIEFFDQNMAPICQTELPTLQSGHCSRSYVNWDVYPIIKRRAEFIINHRKSCS